MLPAEMKVNSRHLWRFILFRKLGVGLFNAETTRACIAVFNSVRSGLAVMNPGKDITFDHVARQFSAFP